MGLTIDEARRFDALRTLVREAGHYVRDRFGRVVGRFKSDASMLTDVDGAVESRLGRALAGRFTGDAVVGEEAAVAGTSHPRADYVWVIDPIDGTNNFGRGMPGFSVSIGVLRDGVVIGGAVYDPIAGQLFAAWAGQGAWLDDRPLRVSPITLDRRSLFSIRTPFADGVPDAVAGWLGRYRLRRSGSTALHLCYVALGAIAFVYDHRASLWDIAGAAAVLQESGACFTAPDGAALFPVPDAVWRGAPLAFLAGAPGAYDSALRDLTAVVA